MKIDIKFDNDENDDIIEWDREDTYDFFSTLARIIYPGLIKFKDEGSRVSGGPDVDNEDVPENLQEDDHFVDDGGILEPDKLWYQRWDYVLDEMIWSFGYIVDGYPEDFKDNSDECRARVQNGLRLFGKYYESLWW